MTPEEQQMLNDLANKVAQTPPPQRDPQAEEFIRTRIGSRPDALYLMTQTVLIQNLALDHAKQQIQELQQKVAGVPASGQPSSFLPGAGPVTPRGSGWGSGSGGQQPGFGSPPPPPPVAPPIAPASGGGSSFLRSAATTAAGVAAGALAFEGIRALFGGIEHMAGFGGGPQFGGGGGFLGGGGVAPSETIINNYYESPEREARDGRDDDDSDDSGDDGNDDDSPDDGDDSSFDDNSGDGGSDDNLV